MDEDLESALLADFESDDEIEEVEAHAVPAVNGAAGAAAETAGESAEESSRGDGGGGGATQTHNFSGQNPPIPPANGSGGASGATHAKSARKSGAAEEMAAGAFDPEAYLYNLLHTQSASSFQKSLHTFDISKIHDIVSDSKIRPIMPYLREKISVYENETDTDYAELLASLTGGADSTQTSEYQFILTVNEISSIINQEINHVDSFNKLHYKVVFPELETIVANPVDYASVILLVEQDLASVGKRQEDLRAIVSNEKVLVITMSALQQQQQQQQKSQQQQFRFNEADFAMIRRSCLLLLELNGLSRELSSYMANKLFKFAPNINAIVGPITTSQLLTASGSLKQLSMTPSCNLASLGVKDLSSTTSATKARHIRQTGYLYHSDLVKYLPEDIQKQVMRILSGKIVLAARIDLSKGQPGGEMGQKYRAEIENKIEKLLTPPENQGDKALPIPMDQKSKKRGGRRFGKARERFQMSDLRKAQNKMAFGEQEDTIMDSFGEEIGLGMMRGGSGSLSIKLNSNTKAKMSKGMAARLQQKQEREHLDSLVFADASGGERNLQAGAETTQAAGPEASKNESKWFSGMKRKRED